MSRTLILSFILLLSLIGVVDAGYLAESALTDTALSCNIQGLEGCNTVAQSPYSYFIGIPLGLYGVGFYLLVFVGALIMRYRPHLKFDLLQFMRIITGLGAVASVGFLGLQVFVIQAMCVYCILSAILSFLIFGLFLTLRRPAPVAEAVVVG